MLTPENYQDNTCIAITLALLPQNMASLQHQQRHMFHCWTTTAWSPVLFQQKILTSDFLKLFPEYSKRMIQVLHVHFSRA